eukprot:CCRYP_005916-RA/>CCRYP_005916-RA protein AED:0.18 eAED:0.18 QI:173/1/1/1/0.4/0.33/6/4113/1032
MNDAPLSVVDDHDNNNRGASSSGRRLLSSSYKCMHPYDVGDRYVTFLLENEATFEKLTNCMTSDHFKLIQRQKGIEADNTIETPLLNGNANDDNGDTADGEGGKKKPKVKTDDSIEIDAFQLIMLDPVLGNLTLRYPDTLLPLLEDATVQARQVLRRRMEVTMHDRLTRSRREAEQYNDEDDNVVVEADEFLLALQHTAKDYDPRPLRARLVHLPPHGQCCKPSLSSISASDVGTVVQICGTCVRIGPVRMMESVRRYRCLSKGCGHTFEVQADFGTTNNALPAPIICPAECDDSACGGTSFAIVEGGGHHCDYQEIKVQESAGALTRVGSVPRSILVKLTDDLVDKCNPGDEVVVVGSLHAEWQSGTAGFVANLEIMVGMSMRAHSVRVVNLDDELGGGATSTIADWKALSGSGSAFASSSGNLRERFRREFDVFWSQEEAKRRPIATRDYIVRAVCPGLYGMHAVKLGLLLALIGGAAVSNENAPVNLSEIGEHESETNHASTDGIETKTMEYGPVAFKIGGDDDVDHPKDNLKRKGIDSHATKNSRHRSNDKSGRAVRSRRRIQSHILLIGDPGTGKSQFLRFAAALSPRSVLTTGTGSSTAGLTCAAVKDSGNEFSLEAGALALADRGVCCIDEFGCMSKEDRTSIHEAMEQQTISVAKAGIVCKLNARATVVAVMNPTGGIYDQSQSIESNSRLGSALLSRFDLIFVMLDQADCNRDDKIAHFLLQQSIIPGSGYDCPIEIEKNLNDGETSGHWSMEKLRAYIAIVRDKFHPTLTREASQLLENHYALCRQSKTEKSLPITVRFLESLIRLAQAHARLMYRDTVLLEDAVAVILLMEFTATAYQNQRDSPDFPSDDFLFKNPVGSEFRPFSVADAEFEGEKQKLLARYRDAGSSSNPAQDRGGNDHQTPVQNVFDHFDQRRKQGTASTDYFSGLNEHKQPLTHQNASDAVRQGGHDQSLSHNHQYRHASQPDQYGRQMFTQTPSRDMRNIRETIATMDANEYTPENANQDLYIQGMNSYRIKKRTAD